MKTLLLFCFVALMWSQIVAQSPQSTDVSLLRTTDVAYTDAMDFARFLDKYNFVVQSVHRYKLEGFFLGVEKAAYFKTEKGVVEVIFFPDSKGAEEVKVTERRSEKRYIYSFQGQPRPNPQGDTFNSAQPMYFMLRRNLFIVSSNKELSEALKSVLAKE